jgi:PEP-CTERM motif-containing protein
MRSQARVSGLFIAAVLAPISLEGSSLSYNATYSFSNAPGNFFDQSHELQNAHSNDALSFHHDNGGSLPYFGSVSADVSFGSMRAFSHTSGGDDNPPGSTFSATTGVHFYDSITIHGASSGFLSLNVSIHGWLDTSSGPQDEALGIFQLWTFTAGGGVQTNYGGIGMHSGLGAPPGVSPYGLLDSLGTAVGFGPDSDGYGFHGQGTVLIPFNASSFDLLFGLSAVASCYSPCSATSDFGNTATIGGATILDSQFVPIAGAFLTSDSGYSYLADPGPTGDVPEPASAILTAIGLGVLAWGYRSKTK